MKGKYIKTIWLISLFFIFIRDYLKEEKIEPYIDYILIPS